MSSYSVVISILVGNSKQGPKREESFFMEGMSGDAKVNCFEVPGAHALCHSDFGFVF